MARLTRRTRARQPHSQQEAPRAGQLRAPHPAAQRAAVLGNRAMNRLLQRNNHTDDDEFVMSEDMDFEEEEYEAEEESDDDRDPVEAYDEAFDDGWGEGYDHGLGAGLDELVQDRIITRQQRGNIYQNQAIPPQAVVYPPGVNVAAMHPAEAEDLGGMMGRGMGNDDGYETAIRDYGYSRKYQAIPGPNSAVALADNNYTCVYCGVNATADVDHVQPLKAHWRQKGAMMGLGARSAEANHVNNLVGSCATCNRSKGSKILGPGGWWPTGWPPGNWWPHGPPRALANNNPPPYW